MRLLRKERTVTVSDFTFGLGTPIVIAGPCSVESREQIIEIAKAVKQAGAQMLRGGVFKPRTNPYDFQGLGLKGLDYLLEAKALTGLPIVTELMDERYLDIFVEQVDLIQIGSRNMYNYALLRAVGETKKPILLKRGMSATIKEWIMAAEHILKAGNDQIILCERGIRTFETYTRNTLDLAAVPIMKRETGLPVIVDPSHGTGRRDLIEIMSKTAIASGADGLLIEAHINPDEAVSDKEQTIDIGLLEKIIRACNTY
ncbi:3-deoxy-7-phosphoheptulonate synthase [Fusibacter sp. 3D3]|uniref:3-deoxy-7-phosphoheptulonate synthase n=1 Tax=Fusibacter sp. 3D3 TaxID=1048380 RepID=UPI0008532A4D|nr:3-deoxy-7-phosphoheptulonate synthase [Fusibacter sp. 3D3]GAU77207.1 2-keto-3-deoxy-D-arabino-heptulosonate-7-phosphate synthase I beta [Fusibacter sp. 3D3]